MGPIQWMKKMVPPIWKAFVKRHFLGHRDTEEFFRVFFSLAGHKKIIQVGANDGEMTDPLRPFLKEKGDFEAVLVEPLPFYSEKLRKLYQGRKEIRIEQVACGASKGDRDLFYIPPFLADQMNGNGPLNNWAHGQGSFDHEVVVHWIRENSFRGEDYVQNIERFIAGIQSVKIQVLPIRELYGDWESLENSLLVMDVQGAEMEVLQGIDWGKAPRFIVLEDDLDRGPRLKDFLTSKGYRFLCGTTDKVFCLKDEKFRWE